MSEFIDKDEELKKKYDLLTSIRGVGKVLTVTLLICTQGFSKLDDARKLACYCGVAPFEYKSGTSVRGKTGIAFCQSGDKTRTALQTDDAQHQVCGHFKCTIQ